MQTCWHSEEYVNLYTQYLVWATFAQTTASVRCGMEAVSLWCLSSFSGQYLIDSLLGPGQASQLANPGTVIPWSANRLLVVWHHGKVQSPAEKGNQHLHRAGQQMEAWRALKPPARWFCWLNRTQWTYTSRWHSAPNHHWLWRRHTGLQANWILCFSGTLIFKLYEKSYFDLTRGLSKGPVLFLLGTVKTPLKLPIVLERLGKETVHFLDTSVQVASATSVQSLWSSWIRFAWQSSLGCGLLCCFCTFAYHTIPFQSIFLEYVLIQHPASSSDLLTLRCQDGCQVSTFSHRRI